MSVNWFDQEDEVLQYLKEAKALLEDACPRARRILGVEHHTTKELQQALNEFREPRVAMSL